jgi:hypothetical protein
MKTQPARGTKRLWRDMISLPVFTSGSRGHGNDPPREGPADFILVHVATAASFRQSARLTARGMGLPAARALFRLARIIHEPKRQRGQFVSQPRLRVGLPASPLRRVGTGARRAIGGDSCYAGVLGSPQPRRRFQPPDNWTIYQSIPTPPEQALSTLHPPLEVFSQQGGHQEARARYGWRTPAVAELSGGCRRSRNVTLPRKSRQAPFEHGHCSITKGNGNPSTRKPDFDRALDCQFR